MYLKQQPASVISVSDFRNVCARLMSASRIMASIHGTPLGHDDDANVAAGAYIRVHVYDQLAEVVLTCRILVHLEEWLEIVDIKGNDLELAPVVIVLGELAYTKV